MTSIPPLESLLMEECIGEDTNSSMGLDYSESLCNVSEELRLLLGRDALYPQYYSIKYRIVGTLFQGFVFIVGVLGNVLVVLVVHRTASMHTPTNCYLVSLAIADCLVLIAAVPNEIIAYYLVGDEWVWGRIGCAVFIFLQYLGVNASSLSITAFTVERYIAICHPMKAQTVCTVRRAKRIIACVWAFAVCYCCPWLMLTETKPLIYVGIEVKEKCTFALTRDSYLGYYFADLVMFYVCPLILSCILYALIARILFSSNLPKAPGQANGFHCADSKKSVTNIAARVQVVKMLVAVVTLFALLWLPYRVFVVYNSLAKDRYMELWFLMFAKTTIYINSAINPIVYNAMSVKFRRAFRRMLACGGPLSRSRTLTETERSIMTIRLRTTSHHPSHYPAYDMGDSVC